MSSCVAGVVQVVLAVHLRALRREQVRDRVADRDPAAAARVQRAGRVRRHELEVDPPALRARPSVPNRSPAATTSRSTSCSHDGARKRLRKPGPAISTRSRWGAAAASSAALISSATSPVAAARPVTAMATGVAQSPWSRCLAGSRTTPAAGSGSPAVASACWRAVRRASWIMCGANETVSYLLRRNFTIRGAV